MDAGQVLEVEDLETVVGDDDPVHDTAQQNGSPDIAQPHHEGNLTPEAFGRRPYPCAQRAGPEPLDRIEIDPCSITFLKDAPLD